MYRIQIPVINATLEPEKALTEIQKAGAQRVWLALPRGIEAEEKLQEGLDLLKKNQMFFEERGYEVGVWISSLGHGGALAQDDPDELVRAERYEKIVGL